MAGTNADEACGLVAGEFGAWLAEMGRALRDEAATDVPCGDCTACCTASQFIHVAPDESETLARIPRALLFPAPGLPKGHVLMGYDERGHCPMLRDDACSIYEDRPRTCRTYDCRIFPASAVALTDEEKISIAQRSRRWTFTYATDADRVRHAATRAAATYLREHSECFPDGAVPSNATQLAVLAVEIHDVFLHRDEPTGGLGIEPPTPERVAAAVVRRR
jgi:Predicted Fe-S-cluster oxidoreductase